MGLEVRRLPLSRDGQPTAAWVSRSARHGPYSAAVRFASRAAVHSARSAASESGSSAQRSARSSASSATRTFLLIGEIERRLRRRVDKRFSRDDLQAVATKRFKVDSAKDLSLGGYVLLLDHEDRWRQMDWNCTRAVFLPRLTAVQQMRIRTMHFDAEPPTDDDSPRLGISRIGPHPRPEPLNRAG